MLILRKSLTAKGLKSSLAPVPLFSCHVTHVVAERAGSRWNVSVLAVLITY